MKPFVKWAGGKTQLLPVIYNEFPKQDKIKKYIELFIGGGAVFLDLIENQDYEFETYVINDLNGKLINVFFVLRDNLDGLTCELDKMKEKYLNLSDEERKEFFYDIRKKFNNPHTSKTEQAAEFIFLNKTCFNGLYRENSKGEFNVPFANPKNPAFYDKENMQKISTFLNKRNKKGDFVVEIYNKEYSELLELIDEATFIYLDPPYRPVTKAGFTAYTKSNFNDDSQKELHEFCCHVHEKGALFLQSNSDPKNLDESDEFFDELYSDFIITRTEASRMINSNGTGRGKIKEILIKNY
ncbi:MAG: DNA adenine methylase [Culicoidibacterales bacterium]